MHRTPRAVPDGGAEAVHLQQQAAQLGVALESRQAETLLAFRNLVERWNRAFNLVSRRDIGRLVPRHLLDSLSVMPWLAGTEVLDLGTGAGFPGIPLAIAREDAQFTLIDSSERKIRFVRQAVRGLGLANVTARCGDVRALPVSASFDTIVCRAVAEPRAAWTLAGARVRPGGRMVIMSRTGADAIRPERTGRPAAAAAGGGRGVSDAALPPDACLEQRHHVQIPGLPAPHELTLLHRHGDAPGQRA